MQKGLNIFLLTKDKRSINEHSRLSHSNPSIKLHKNKRITTSPQENTRTKTLLHKIKLRLRAINSEYRTWPTFRLANDKSAY